MITTTAGDEVQMLREKLRGHDCAGGPNECGDCCACREAQALLAELRAQVEALERLADIEDKSFADNCYCACCGEHPAHGQPFGGHADNCALVAARLAIAKARGDAMTLPDHTKPPLTSPPPVERTLATQAEECRCTCTRREP